MKMLEYVKLILEKVSFEKKLFEKELNKGLKMLSVKELKELRKWCYEKFGSAYKGVLNRAFSRAFYSFNLKRRSQNIA